MACARPRKPEPGPGDGRRQRRGPVPAPCSFGSAGGADPRTGGPAAWAHRTGRGPAAPPRLNPRRNRRGGARAARGGASLRATHGGARAARRGGRRVERRPSRTARRCTRPLARGSRSVHGDPAEDRGGAERAGPAPHRRIRACADARPRRQVQGRICPCDLAARSHHAALRHGRARDAHAGPARAPVAGHALVPAAGIARRWDRDGRRAPALRDHAACADARPPSVGVQHRRVRGHRPCR